MANPAGSFIWYELMTPDPDAVAPFYAAVVGWSIGKAEPDQSGGSGGMDYRMIGRSDGRFAGGVLRLSADMLQHGVPPMWLGYLSTPDVDRTVAAIVSDGGRVRMPAATLPNVGRIAMVTDPQGVPFYLMTPVPPPGDPAATSDVFDPDARERVNWNELASPDLAAAKAFYARHFGFAFNESLDMGPMGEYCFIDHHGQRIGAIMQRPDGAQPATWLFYVGVPSIAAAVRAIDAHGGTLLSGPDEVPTGEWVVVAADPAGAGFGLAGPKGE
ncbi:MAG: VOC family protein [Vicinamibacterales bacterium]